MRKILGRNKQVDCLVKDFYEFIGYLASHPEDARIVFEHNSEQGAWGNEGRIQFRSSFVRNHFGPLGIKVTAGVAGSYDSRLNCNPLFYELIELGFDNNGVHDVSKIRGRVPAPYVAHFDIGMAL